MNKYDSKIIEKILIIYLINVTTKKNFQYPIPVANMGKFFKNIFIILNNLI
jgi:hypothetical protein